MEPPPLHLFEAFGVEIEYMLVDRGTLDVRPAADVLLSALGGGATTGDYKAGPITWSNELCLHVIELKSTLPVINIARLATQMRTAIAEAAPTLERMGACLLPTAMHPWMRPAEQAKIWPHEYGEVYATYDRIFGCKSHGWSNMQSVHLNLPFHGDDEFGRLHAAVRLVLPILPGLAASSPVVEGRRTGWRDTRMHHYAGHCDAISALIGQLIPEGVFDEATYRATILEPTYRDVRPHDPEGHLRGEFLNARGAIARFDRGSIEIRVIDAQEYPAADVAICAATIGVLQALVAQRWCPYETQQAMETERLRAILDLATEQAEDAIINDGDFLRIFGIDATQCRIGEMWEHLLDATKFISRQSSDLVAPLRIIREQGTLATRISHALGPDFSPKELHRVYSSIAACLNRWESFQP